MSLGRTAAGARRVALLCVVVAATAGCVAHPVGPARTFDSYSAKASTTLKSTISAVETVRLLADTATDGGLFGPYAAVAVSEQEDTLGGLRGTFMSIQPPPDERSAQLRHEMSQQLTDAFDHVGDVRIEARRGRLDQLAIVAAPLAEDIDGLNDLLDELS
jgi:hypothetical protein